MRWCSVPAGSKLGDRTFNLVRNTMDGRREIVAKVTFPTLARPAANEQMMLILSALNERQEKLEAMAAAATKA